MTSPSQSAEPEAAGRRRRPVRLGELVALVAATLVGILGGYELVERFVLPPDLPMATVHGLHLLRAIAASVAAAALVAWYLMRRGDAAFEAEVARHGAPGLLDREERGRQYALWFVQMRWIAVGMAVVLITVAVPLAGVLPRWTLWPLLSWVVALVGANLVFDRWARRGTDPGRQILVQALVDLVVLTGLLNASGGIENPLYIAYLFHVIIGSILLPRRLAVWVTAGACALFTILAAGEYTGLFPHETNVLFPHGSLHDHGEAGAGAGAAAEHVHPDGEVHVHAEGGAGPAAGPLLGDGPGEAAVEPEHASHDPVFVAGRVLPFLAVLVLTSYLTMLVASRLQRSEEDLVRTAREALLERRRLESVVHAAGLGIVLYGSDREVRWCNRRAREWLGRAVDAECPPPPEAADAGEPGASADGLRRGTLEACLERGRPAEMERSAPLPGGGLRYLRHAFSPVRDREGRVVQAVELIEDVSARKALEAEALHAGKLSALGQMAAGVAHEIGNPLSSLKTRLRLLERRRDPDFLAESLKVLHGQIDRIGRIVRGVSEFARNRGQEWTEWEVAPVVEEALSMVRLDRRAKSVSFETEVPEPPLRMRGVRDQILQVVLNLLLNAVQAMPEGGRVRLEAARHDGTITLSVADTGVGMDEVVRRRLFDPFFTTREEGTGLGLSISYSLVHAHGGRIEVESAPGRGSRFTVVLPEEGGPREVRT